jgi:hypothetical protein
MSKFYEERFFYSRNGLKMKVKQFKILDDAISNFGEAFA